MGGYAQFNRWDREEYAATTYLFRWQPIPAIIGFLGCFAVLFIFATAPLWGESPSAAEVFFVYTMVSRLFSLSFNVEPKIRAVADNGRTTANLSSSALDPS